MKKSMIAVFAGLMSVAALADINNTVLVSFSTPGPDHYADGVKVIDGEIYALVWTPKGEEFAGINADGTAVAPSKVALLAPIASGGKCPCANFQIDEAYVASITGGAEGTWGVYLLDTRRYPTVKDAEGNDVVDKTGTPTVGGATVNGYGAVATLTGGSMASGAASGAVAVTTGSAAPAAASNLKVNDIKFVGDNVYIYVTGSLSCLQYELKSGSEPGALAAPADGKAQYGTGDDNMVIITPKKPGAQFFQVNRK